MPSHSRRPGDVRATDALILNPPFSLGWRDAASVSVVWWWSGGLSGVCAAQLGVSGQAGARRRWARSGFPAVVWSCGRGERAQPFEDVLECVAPGPSCWEV